MAEQAVATEGGRLTTGAVVVLAVVLGTAVPVALHGALNGVINPHQVALAFFFWLNAIICFWELCLFFHIDAIRAQYEGWVEAYRGRELDRVVDLFTAPMAPEEVLSTRRWAEIWSSYALFDDCYATKGSFGFMVDIGNGWTMLLPSLFFVYGMSLQVVSPQVLGIVGLVTCWQMLYGTLLYFTSYVLNRQYVGHSWRNLVLFVGLSNAVWVVFPLWGLWVSTWMIFERSYAIFG